MKRFTDTQEMEQFIAEEHNNGLEYRHAEITATNLERMYTDYPQLWDTDEYSNDQIPNDNFETWFYQQNTSTRSNMSTCNIFRNYNQLCRARGGKGY